MRPIRCTNTDPTNPAGRPDAEDVLALGFDGERLVPRNRDDCRDYYRRHAQQGREILLVITADTMSDYGADWRDPGQVRAAVARVLSDYPSLAGVSLGNEPDGNEGASWVMTPEAYRTFHNAAADVVWAAGIPVCTAGFSSGQVDRMAEYLQGISYDVALCLVPDQLVTALGVAKATMRHFEGDVVTIETAGGNKVSCTPNHPILTRQGWLPAHLIKEGSEVAKYSGVNARVQKRSNDVDVPTPISEVFRSLNLSGRPSSRPGMALDFHGDGRSGNVHIVGADRLLRGAFTQSNQNVGLEAADRPPGSLVRGGNALSGDTGLRLSASVLPGRSGIGGQLRPLIRPLVTDFLSLTVIPSRKSTILEQHVQSGRLLANGRPQLFKGLSGQMALMELSNATIRHHQVRPRFAARFDQQAVPLEEPEHGGTPRESNDGREVLRSLAGQVTFVDVRQVSVAHYRGHVYNLSTENGLIVADNIITSNCHLYAKTPEEARVLVRDFKAKLEPGKMWGCTEWHRGELDQIPRFVDMLEDEGAWLWAWFAHSDGMVFPFGMLDRSNNLKPLGGVLRDHLLSKPAPESVWTAPDLPVEPPVVQPPEVPAVATLDMLRAAIWGAVNPRIPFDPKEGGLALCRYWVKHPELKLGSALTREVALDDGTVAQAFSGGILQWFGADDVREVA